MLNGFFEVSSYHDHETVGTKTSLEGTIEPLLGHQVLQNNHYRVEVGYSLQPALHELCRHASQVTVLSLLGFDCNVYFYERLDFILQFKRLPNLVKHWDVVVLHNHFQKTDAWVDL